MNVTDLLSKLTTKAQINFDDPKFAAIKELKGDFPDEEAKKIFSSLMTMDEAKSNYTLKNHFIADILDPADQEIIKLADEKGLSPEAKEKILSQKSTYKKIPALVEEIQALEAAKAGATVGDKKALQEKINELTTKISEMPKTHAEELKRVNSEWKGKFTDNGIRTKAAGKKFALKDIPVDVNIETAMVLLNKQLAKDKAKVLNTDTGLKLVNADDETLDWLSPANEKTQFDAYFDNLLAENKMLEVSNAASNGAANGTPPSNGAPVVQGVKPFNSGTFDSKLDQKIAEQERIYGKS